MTMQLAELIDPADLAKEIEAGYVIRKQHPTLPLSILTYSRGCQYDRHWTPVTTRCRGLIVDDTDRIIARPFDKFFNVGEHDRGYDYAPPLPDEPFEIYDKVDGSLGIVFWYADAWHATSKGSFISEQAQWAQRWLENHPLIDDYLTPGVTYLTEIVYPENRIVVNNGGEQTLVLLAVTWAGGMELPLRDHASDWWAIGGRVVQSWNALPLPKLVEMAAANEKLDGTPATGTDAEGWVLRYANGLRVKAKYAEYVRLHKVLTGINARDVWRTLAATIIGDKIDARRTAQALNCSAADIEALRKVPDPLGAILENVPDEFDQWVRGICADLTAHADALLSEIEEAFHDLAHLAEDRGSFARAVQALAPEIRAAMFLKLDGKDLALHIWKTIKPEVTTPFRDDEEG